VEVWRDRVMEFSPMVMKEEISGVGGMAGVSGGSRSLGCDSWHLRFLLRFPLDLGAWLARCWPMGERSLENSRLSVSRSQRKMGFTPAEKL